jgi:hypothetical protein
MGQQTWQTLLQTILETEPDEIDCVECFEVLDQYVELILTELDPTQLMPLVKQHLKNCPCCSHQFEALLVMLQAQ